eukprot:CAMPEP_0114334028 /NCGR_PEP_ID=MMETSP0101-20121206/4117_1 /TAXON_ID=38822 ORGANISM="Pteridomonas danica, Strain PT" /NCGR_SAMPLE_ID=MMETSP0101 /ASSEMBLY_ACC=CAM_ASM_000211 /LENGTH=187 /DNA_ID=CAMNT_0001465181 /DNA_START=240 /DNA_END=804 /DNA_ORIENTATION=-
MIDFRDMDIPPNVSGPPHKTIIDRADLDDPAPRTKSRMSSFDLDQAADWVAEDTNDPPDIPASIEEVNENPTPKSKQDKEMEFPSELSKSSEATKKERVQKSLSDEPTEQEENPSQMPSERTAMRVDYANTVLDDPEDNNNEYSHEPNESKLHVDARNGRADLLKTTLATALYSFDLNIKNNALYVM